MATVGRYSWVTAYDLTVGTIVNIDEAIYMTSAVDSPFLTGVDSDGLSVLSSLPTNQRKVSWLHDAILTPRATLAAQITTTAATTVGTLTIGSGEGFNFEVGDVVMVDSEHMRIDSIPDSVTLTVTRGGNYGSTALHLTSATVIGVGHALAEGSNPGDTRATDRVEFYNVTQIFGPSQVSMSATEQVVPKYGVPSEMPHQLFQRTQELTLRRENAILYGRRIEDDSATRRTMGGLFSFITTNTTSTAVLNVTSVANEQQVLYSAGGQPDRLAANPISLSDLNQTSDTARVRMDMADSRRGRVPVMTILTEFGPLTVVRNRWFRTTDAVLFKRDQVVRRPLRPLVVQPLAKTGDRDSVQIVCEESLEVKGQQHMAKFTGLSYS